MDVLIIGVTSAVLCPLTFVPAVTEYDSILHLFLSTYLLFLIYIVTTHAEFVHYRLMNRGRIAILVLLLMALCVLNVMHYFEVDGAIDITRYANGVCSLLSFMTIVWAGNQIASI
tara:strand:- start:3466 stop:3810 length:345 start_codon:yes stop_codon:yes gene_type:complete